MRSAVTLLAALVVATAASAQQRRFNIDFMPGVHVHAVDWNGTPALAIVVPQQPTQYLWWMRTHHPSFTTWNVGLDLVFAGAIDPRACARDRWLRRCEGGGFSADPFLRMPSVGEIALQSYDPGITFRHPPGSGSALSWDFHLSYCGSTGCWPGPPPQACGPETDPQVPLATVLVCVPRLL